MDQPRGIVRTDDFDRQAKPLEKRDREFGPALAGLLDSIAKTAKPPGDRQPGVGGAPVYKVRFRIGNKSQRDGARLIYYCSDTLLLPMYIYAKSDIENIHSSTILKALKAAGLVPDVPESRS